MPRVTSVLVDIVRDFFAAHDLMGRVAGHYRSGELQFEELAEFIGDDEESALFRLKERCHTLFRSGPRSERVPNPKEVLFDLTVGSLFHEAMTFRENFYQREVYGPKVRALRGAGGEESAPFFREFEKIMAAVSDRLDQGLQETETLVEQTGVQLRGVFAEHRENGYLVRHLVEKEETAALVFGLDLQSLLAEIYGSAVEGLSLAGRSYLSSGYYGPAEEIFARAISWGGDRAALEPLCAYARGMAAYLAGDYPECVERFAAWVDADQPGPKSLRGLAHAVIGRIGQLVEGAERERLLPASAALLGRMGASPQPDPTHRI